MTTRPVRDSERGDARWKALAGNDRTRNLIFYHSCQAVWLTTTGGSVVEIYGECKMNLVLRFLKGAAFRCSSFSGWFVSCRTTIGATMKWYQTRHLSISSVTYYIRNRLSLLGLQTGTGGIVLNLWKNNNCWQLFKSVVCTKDRKLSF